MLKQTDQIWLHKRTRVTHKNTTQRSAEPTLCSDEYEQIQSWSKSRRAGETKRSSKPVLRQKAGSWHRSEHAARQFKRLPVL